ncbi:hypothetical protein KBX53_25785 [Micromonospora sp. M51]|uniref:hypothetical protein n=1 Tax=Micromonospora TaxID=1873 RepID=UPI000A920782|nr:MULTISPECIES: hypothetical protein [Micromonospora]MBQ1014290.1 hypothetical protein [Micromonospora sp. M51]
MSTAGPLGEYLRARRELIGPGDVGLPGSPSARSLARLARRVGRAADRGASR